MTNPQNMQHIHGNIPYLIDCWAYQVVHILLLKSSMDHQLIVNNLQVLRYLCLHLLDYEVHWATALSGPSITRFYLFGIKWLRVFAKLPVYEVTICARKVFLSHHTQHKQQQQHHFPATAFKITMDDQILLNHCP